MNANQFSTLEYKDKLQVITRNGKLKLSFNVAEYEITLYKVEDFYVELKRLVKELRFDTIQAMKRTDLPPDITNFFGGLNT